MDIKTPANKEKWIKALFYIFLTTGIAMRLYQHLMGRSLWEDEAHLALNYIYFGYKGLMQPLENFQAAPILFLFTEETMTRLFGFSEVALRTFPFLVTILIYPLYYFVALELTKSRFTALLAFVIMTFSIVLIEMASEAKPYTIDVSCYIGMVYLVVSQNSFVKKHRVLLLSVFGALSMLYSSTSVITLLCIGLYIVYQWKLNADAKGQKLWKSVPFKDLIIFIVWAVVFLANYYRFIHNHPYAEGMKKIWSHTFPPTGSLAEFMTFIKDRINDTFFSDLLYISDELFFPYVLLIIFITAIGYIIYYRKTGMAILPIVLIAVHFLLSVYRLYPFFYRFILYLLPAFIMLISLGITTIVRFLFNRSQKLLAVVFLIFCCAFILKKPLAMYPKWDREIKPSFDFINEKHPDALIYVTTPKTLMWFYQRTDYLKNQNYREMPWFIPPEQYFEILKEEKENYLLLYSTFNGDGYKPIIDELKQKDLVLEEFDYKSYGVCYVKPEASTVNSDTTGKN